MLTDFSLDDLVIRSIQGHLDVEVRFKITLFTLFYIKLTVF